MTLTSVKGAYARDALRGGISMAHSEVFNPLKFGVIGSSDSHNATSPSDEKGYTGKLPMMDGSAGLRTGAAGVGFDKMTPARKWGSGGLLLFGRLKIRVKRCLMRCNAARHLPPRDRALRRQFIWWLGFPGWGE